MSNSIFITGVSSGLGHGLAEYYLKQGDEVYGISRREPPDLIDNRNFYFASCDIADFDKLPDRLNGLLRQTNKCDLAILNAGMLSDFGDMRETPLQKFKEVMDVNVWSNKIILDWLLQHFPEMKQVVTISSGASVNGNRGWNAYSVSKSALNMLTKLYAREAPEIHFCAIAPGLIDTHMQDILCNLPEDERFPALESLKKRRGSEQMPSAAQLSPRLAEAIEKAPANIESGDFFDIRKIDWLTN